MQLLLDTHSFIWWSINSEKLSLTGQDLLFDRNNRGSSLLGMVR